MNMMVWLLIAATGALVGCSDGNETLVGPGGNATSDITTADSSKSDAGQDPSKIYCTEDEVLAGSCNDGNACTNKDTCQKNGECVGNSIPCDDGNACTQNTCVTTTGCAFPPHEVAIPCNDSNACTVNDECNSAGTCAAGNQLACDDQNQCTTDKCDPSKGCLHVFQHGAACDDGDKCTVSDSCADGLCKAGVKTPCNDNNPCTYDQCDPTDGSCVYQQLGDGQPCSDGDGCTEGDACKGAACTPGQKKNCNDGDACTTEKCNSANGICEFFFTNNLLTPCSDSDACTTGDKCDPNLKKCQGTPKLCEDQNLCTSDYCDKSAGCINSPDDGKACTDGNACTQDDKCKQGQCAAGTVKGCNDNNACTDDICNQDTGQCFSKAAEGKQCNDNSKCTLNDTCTTGGICAGVKSPCDDKNPCTSDTCDPVAGCQTQIVNGLLCDDGNPCTLSDTCQEGICKPKFNTCDDTNDCTLDSCNKSTGVCTNKPLDPNTYTCDDGDPCTVNGKCIEGGICKSALKCNDSNPCTEDLCDFKTGACKFNLIPGCKP